MHCGCSVSKAAEVPLRIARAVALCTLCQPPQLLVHLQGRRFYWPLAILVYVVVDRASVRNCTRRVVGTETEGRCPAPAVRYRERKKFRHRSRPCPASSEFPKRNFQATPGRRKSLLCRCDRQMAARYAVMGSRHIRPAIGRRAYHGVRSGIGSERAAPVPLPSPPPGAGFPRSIRASWSSALFIPVMDVFPSIPPQKEHNMNKHRWSTISIYHVARMPGLTHSGLAGNAGPG